MKDNAQDRIAHPKMGHYRHLYRDSKLWSGESLVDKHVAVYLEQGYGDVIQMARYLTPLKSLGAGKLTVQCPLTLCSLLATVPGVDEVFPREEEEAPPHDLHTLSLSLPFMVPDPGNGPYLTAEPMELPDVAGQKVGIAWEGNPNYPKNPLRSCSLRHFKALRRPGRNFFMLQIQPNLVEYAEGCEDFEILGVEMGDFARTAGLVQAMDVVVSVDTSVLHLAGALGKRGYGLLAHDYDRRWMVRKWYDSVEMWRQPRPGDWEGLFRTLPDVLPATP